MTTAFYHRHRNQAGTRHKVIQKLSDKGREREKNFFHLYCRKRTNFLSVKRFKNEVGKSAIEKMAKDIICSISL